MHSVFFCFFLDKKDETWEIEEDLFRTDLFYFFIVRSSLMSHSEFFNKPVIARSEATCLHAEVSRLTLGCLTVPARRRGNPGSLPHGVYAERKKESLPLHSIQGQNDKKRRVSNDTARMPTHLRRSL